MKLMLNGRYYLWDCDWCDSINRTLWAKIANGKVVCGACHASTSISDNGHLPNAPPE